MDNEETPNVARVWGRFDKEQAPHTCPIFRETAIPPVPQDVDISALAVSSPRSVDKLFSSHFFVFARHLRESAPSRNTQYALDINVVIGPNFERRSNLDPAQKVHATNFANTDPNMRTEILLRSTSRQTLSNRMKFFCSAHNANDNLTP